MKTEPTPNLPLLRKVLDWAEAEAAKPTGGLWYQETFFRDTPCGTAYCIAGYAMSLSPGYADDPYKIWPTIDGKPVVFHKGAREALGLTAGEAADLFDGYNDIADVRRVAEEIAARTGERL